MSAKYTFLAWDTPVNNASTKLALLQLANNADDNGFSYYSISKMAKACDMSERSFMRKIQELEAMKVLVVERRANRPSLYTLIGDEMGVTTCHLRSAGVTDCHAGVTTCHSVSDKLSQSEVTGCHAIPTVNPNNYPNINPKSNGGVDFSVFQMTDDELSELKRIRKKNKGGTITQRVANELAKQFMLAANMGYSFDEILTEWETRSWKSFKAEWLKPKQLQSGMSALMQQNIQNTDGWSDE